MDRDRDGAPPAVDRAGRPGAVASRPEVLADRKPSWLRVKVPPARAFRATAAVLDDLDLHTVCDAARCPNKGECFTAGTATFLILGDTCTRACRFCAVTTEHVHGGGSAPGAGAGAAACGRPRARAALRALDGDEPRRVAEAAGRLGLTHVVVTSVTRDDLADGGAAHYAATIAALRETVPLATVEVLVPDFGGDAGSLQTVLDARPDVLNHNLETVPRLYRRVRPQAVWGRSLRVLERAAGWARETSGVATSAPLVVATAHESDPATGLGVTTAHGSDPATGRGTGVARPLVKTGLMVGLGESFDEVGAALREIAQRRPDLVTIGQYLRPAPECLPVARYVPPEEFTELEAFGLTLGLRIIAAPLVRSSYRAGEALGR